MRNLVLASLTIAVFASPALAGVPGGHKADVGIVAYVQDSDRGGGKIEGRWNLAPDDPEAAIYLTVAPGIGSWYYTRKPSGFGKALDAVLVVPWLYKSLTGGYKRKAGNFTEWKTDQTFLDLGMALGWHHWIFGAGVTLVSYDSTVLKLINNDPYTGGKKGSAWGGYGQAGFSFPIGKTFFDVIAGYRQTRGLVKVVTTNAGGATNVAPIRPIYGPYGNIALRLRF
ncbi:MAG: hypothetical protein AAB152_10055 [Candidatus Coatesbacteria bacterium]